MKYLLTGATGHLGQHVLESLLQLVDTRDVAISVRDPQKATAMKKSGITVRQGDFDDFDSLLKAFENVERLLIISADGDNETRIRQHTTAVKAAKAAGVRFIAYTSATQADQSELFLAEVHKTTEKAIKDTGIPYVILRNNWYLENEATNIQSAASNGSWLTAVQTGKVGWSLRKDYAKAAAYALAGKGEDNSIYELSGAPLTQEQLAHRVSQIIHREVVVNRVSYDEYAEIMRGFGLPDFLVDMLKTIQQDIEKGTLDFVSNDYERLVGEPMTPLEVGIKALLV